MWRRAHVKSQVLSQRPGLGGAQAGPAETRRNGRCRNRAPGKRNRASPENETEPSTAKWGPPRPERASPFLSDPRPRLAPRAATTVAARGLEVPSSTWSWSRWGGKFRHPEGTRTSAFMPARPGAGPGRGGAGAGPAPWGAGAAEAVTCSGGWFPVRAVGFLSPCCILTGGCTDPAGGEGGRRGGAGPSACQPELRRGSVAPPSETTPSTPGPVG